VSEKTAVWLKIWTEPDQEPTLFNSIKQMKGIELEKFDRSTDPSKTTTEGDGN